MTTEETRQAARELAAQAHQVGRVSGREPLKELVRWISRGRLGQPTGWPTVPRLTTPWQDTISPERRGWRQRAARLGDTEAFAVDYRICCKCGLGWVEQPATEPGLERCGLASAGLAALRAEYPGLSWHTLGGHLHDSRPFWNAVGDGVPGHYRQREVCPHITPG